MIVSRDFFNEAAIANPPRRGHLDWWLVGALVVVAILEGIFNQPLFWRAWHIALVIAVIPTLLWRREKPLLMMTIGFVAVNLSLLAAVIGRGEVPEGPYAAAFILINVYAVFRWASGRHCAIGLVMMFAAFFFNIVIDYGGIGEAIGGLIVLLLPAELGIVARYQARNRELLQEEVRSGERERIARELHDSVAHHVSAIAITAQAGRAVAANDPERAVEALASIEEAASRTLSDMRSMVGSLRGDDGAELTPQPGLRELVQLEGVVGDIEVAVDMPEGHSAPTAVSAALYRIAQESVTNAVRHARGASRVDVLISHTGDAYQLTVTDDGRQNATTAGTHGYGLIGMAERARLLGGSFDAGPSSAGWVVRAELPAEVSQ